MEAAQDFVSFNEEFQRILLDTPNISNYEQTDSYSLLKPIYFQRNMHQRV